MRQQINHLPIFICTVLLSAVAWLPTQAQSMGFIYHEPTPVPHTLWFDEAGEVKSLQDYRGQVVLLNVWGTWCTPCLVEMPTLDKLQRKYGKHGLKVLPLAMDNDGLGKIRAFYRRAGIRHLDIHVDPDRMAVRLFEVRKMPTTYLINRNGEMIAELSGAADWFSPEAQQVIQQELQKSFTPEATNQTSPATPPVPPQPAIHY